MSGPRGTMSEVDHSGDDDGDIDGDIDGDDDEESGGWQQGPVRMRCT